MTNLPYAPPCDLDLDLETAHGIAIMLTRYCEWLNTWAGMYDGETPYRPTMFLDYNSDQQLYGRIEIAAIYDSTDHTVLALRIHDGDEGGPHGLTGWWSSDPVWVQTDEHLTIHPGNYKTVGYTQQLNHMTGEFDTYLTITMKDGTLTYHGQDHPSKT